MSFFDNLDAAHEAYKRRHSDAQKFSDDCCQCLTCRAEDERPLPEPKDQTA